MKFHGSQKNASDNFSVRFVTSYRHKSSFFKSTFFKMVGGKRRFTRYFLFWRVNPSPNDYELLKTSCKTIDAYFGYKTEHGSNKTILKGFFILRGVKACASGKSLYSYFPNFLITSVGTHFNFNFEDMQPDITLNGYHPFNSIRKNLFKDRDLTRFMNKSLIYHYEVKNE